MNAPNAATLVIWGFCVMQLKTRTALFHFKPVSLTAVHNFGNGSPQMGKLFLSELSSG
jgi:hypothetical protein